MAQGFFGAQKKRMWQVALSDMQGSSKTKGSSMCKGEGSLYVALLML